MAEEKTQNDFGKISRREFLKEAGLVVGGATVGSMTLLGACSGDTETVTKTVTNTVTNTVTKTVTSPPVTDVVETSAGSVTLTINGRPYTLLIDPHWTLQYVLHNKLQLTGAKMMCAGEGQCGSCTVIMDGRPILSCLTLAIECVGHEIETIEGAAMEKHPIIDAFIKNEGMQCGYCTPGAIMTAKALLNKVPNPTAGEIQEALSGNVCLCGTYPMWIKAVDEAAKGGK